MNGKREWPGASLGMAWLALLFLTANVGAAESLSRDYIIGPKDLIEIQVYEQPDLHMQVRVSEEGRISLPLIGDVKASAYTVEELNKAVTEKYSEYIYHPQVSVFIREYHTKDIYILGEVKRPGVYQVTGNHTVLDLLTQAGGTSETGGDTVSIIRKPKPGEEVQTLIIKLTKMLESGSQEGNVMAIEGDTIYVPRADFYFVFGEVSKPGSYKLEKEMRLNVLKAITLAGGFTDKAAKSKIKITREKEGRQTTFKADLDTEVLPHDIIIIPESFF